MTPRARPMHPDDRRAAIIAATRPLLIEHRGALTTRLIAEASGIAEGTLFRVFANKRELLLAVAEDTVNPAGGREELERALAGLPDLRARVTLVVEALSHRMEQALLVMMGLRAAMQEEPGPPGPPPGPPGPPAFLIEAQEQLVLDLEELLFAPYADQLRLPPRRAALLLRSITLGARHPGLPCGEGTLSVDEIVSAVLDGIQTTDSTGER